MAKLASLVVDLQLQSAQLRQGLDEANRKLDEFAKQSERTASILEGVFTFDVLRDGLTALGTFITEGAAAVGTMDRLAKAAGTPVEEFSKLAYAAERFGYESDNLGESFGQLAEYMAEAKNGSAEHRAMFKGLGVEYEGADKKLRSTGDVFKDLAQRFSETADGSAKTALAVKFFGEEGIKLIPMLNQGKAGLAALGEEAARTGGVITEQGAASAAEFNAALHRLTKAGEGLAAAVVQELAPSMSAFAKEVTTSKDSAEAFEMAAESLAFVIRSLATAAVTASGVFEWMGETLAGVSSSFVNRVSGDVRAAEGSLDAAGEELRKTLTSTTGRIKAIWETSGPGASMAADAEKAKPAADEHLAAIERTKKAAEDAAAAQKKAADRAAESQKKLAEAAKKAAEESAKALDEYVKSALSLERQHEAIDRAAAKRMADTGGLSATEGFSDMEEALSRMVETQKAAATMRGRASEREREGDIIGADSATRKADELDVLAERASGAVDTFREMAKTAEEKSTEAMEAQIAAAAALEQTFDGIDQEVAARLSAVYDQGADPTAGFESFNTALFAMSEALKEEARLRSEAALLEKEGKLGEARQALLAAEATRVLADGASAAADALAAMEQARANVPSELGGMLTGGIGGTTSAMVEGVQTGAAAGPVGAVVGGLVGLLSQSETFQHALSSLEEIFQALADSVGSLVEPLLPLLEVVGAVAQGLGSLLEVLSPIIEFVARPLFEMFKGFGMVVLGLVKFVGEIIDSIAEFFGGEGIDLKGVDEAMATLEGTTYDAARGNKEVAETAREAAGGINQVSWWRESLARFNSVENGRTGGGGSTVVNDNSQHNYHFNGLTDPEAFAEHIEERTRGRNNRNGGNRNGDLEMP